MADPKLPEGRKARNPFLSPAMHRMLVAIRDSDDEYAIEEGRECWVDLDKFSKNTVNRLLRLALLRVLEENAGTTIYGLNEDSIAILNDPNFIPPAVELFKKN